MHGICNLSIVPCRKKPSDKSELISQLLFGETFQLLEEQEKWVKIKNDHDQYISWIDRKQFLSISEKTHHRILKEPIALTFELVHPITDTSTGNLFPILLGSNLPGIKNQKFEIEKNTYKYDGQLSEIPSAKKMRSTLIENAFLYLHAPYLWGGRTPFGIDCSGLTQMVYKLSGIQLLRDASEQATMGKSIDFVEQAQPGDLAFFDNQAGRITHVGILLGNKTILHASGKVRIDKFDHYGIYNKDTKTYTHSLRLIRALL